MATATKAKAKPKAHPNLNQNDADIETPNKLQGRPRKQIEARKELKKGGK